jgi:hypothetical protein
MDDLTPPAGLSLAEAPPATAALIEAADAAARNWTGPDAIPDASPRAPIVIGSPAHKLLACSMFRETFNPYKPSIIDWPKLALDARDRLVNLPIWDIAVQTEDKAKMRMSAYADRLVDPDWRAAIALNGWEEGRHRIVLSNLVQAYGIALAPAPTYQPPTDTEWAYLVTGFSECIDSFFAFGLFALAKRSAFFPPELVDTFEPVIQEEGRHILLFANWLAWHRRNLSFWRRPWFELRVAAVWVFLGWERVGIARGMDDGSAKAPAQDNNFTVTGSKAISDVEISVPDLMALCLSENDRRFAGYDTRLLRPTTMPTLVRAALRVVGLWRRVRGREAAAA